MPSSLGMSYDPDGPRHFPQPQQADKDRVQWQEAHENDLDQAAGHDREV